MPGKVFLLNHGLASGGTDTFTIETAKGLWQKGYDVSVVMAVDPDSPAQVREHVLASLGIPLYKTKDPVGLRGVWMHAKRLYALLRQEKPDVFHANMDLFNGVNMLVAWLARVPVRVCHAHTTASQYETDTGKHFAVYVYRGVMRTLIRWFANRYCGCSEMAMQYLYRNWWKRSPAAHVIYNGIDLSAFRNADACRTVDAPHTLITVGAISKTKNPRFLVEVVQRLAGIRQDFVLLWVGDGDLRAQTEEAARQRQLDEHIRFLGRRSDVPQLLRSADAFVMPSLFEGLPVALIEAQAAGLPAFVSDAVTREADCGLCAFLPIDDASVWADRISEAFDRGAQQPIDEERLRRFDASAMIERLEEVYFD